MSVQVNANKRLVRVISLMLNVGVKCFADRRVRRKIQDNHNLNIIGIKKQVSRMVKGQIMKGETFNFTPSPDDVIDKGDVLVMIGKEEDLDRFCSTE